MEIKEMTIEELQERSNQIMTELEKPEANLDALEEEARAIKEELETRKAEEAKKNEERSKVAEGAGKVKESIKETKEMSNLEVRKSMEYMEAYKNYIINGNDQECRALLTENASGEVPVPVMLEGAVRKAWENDSIMSRVHKTFVKGNLKVAFEKDTDPAYVHTEGTSAPTEEDLDLGVVTLVPATIKKWLTISDEVADMAAPEFLQYIRDEIAYQIVKKMADLGIGDIVSAGTSHSASAIGLPKVNEGPSLTAIASAAAYLSDEARNVCIVLNRQTEVEFLAAQAAGNFMFDPFMGLPRVYSSALPAYATASDNDTYAIVGDLDALQYNFPNGDGVKIKWDEMTLAEADLIKIIGRAFAGHGVTAPGKLARLTKPAAATT